VPSISLDIHELLHGSAVFGDVSFSGEIHRTKFRQTE
jgi:hypothetical protein